MSNNLLLKFEEITGLSPLNRESTVNLGYSYAWDHPGFIIEIMKQWVNHHDLKLSIEKKHSFKYADLLGQRGFNYEEFRFAVQGSLPEDQFHRSIVMEILFIDDLVEKEKLKYRFDDEMSMKGQYLGALKNWIEFECPRLEKAFFKTKIPINIPLNTLRRHGYCLGKSGSGKSELIKVILYDLIRNSQKNNSSSIVLIDPHSDLSIEVLRFVMNNPKYSDRVIYLDPDIRSTAIELFDEDLIGKDLFFTINPFENNNLNESDFASITEFLSEALFSLIDSHETYLMETLIESCVETLLRKENSDLSDLRRFMDDDLNQDLVSFGSKIPNQERALFIKNKLKADGRLSSTKNSISMRVLKLIGNPKFRRSVCGRSTLNLEEAINSGKVIIINASKSSYGSLTSSAIGKFITALLCAFAFRRVKMPKSKRLDTFLFIDEFQNFVSESIEDIMAETRKFKMFSFLSNQQVGQNMNAQVKRMISGNTSLKIAGDNETESLEFMASQMKHLTLKDFEDLPQYSFWVNDTTNKAAGSFKVRVPDTLVNTNSKYYMSDQEFKDFFKHIAFESGVYRETEPQETDKILVEKENIKVYENPFKE